MGAAEQRNKDKMHAAYMKEHGIIRRTGQCAIGHHITAVPMVSHFNVCPGPSRRVSGGQVPAKGFRPMTTAQAIASAEAHADDPQTGTYLELQSDGKRHPVTYERPTDYEYAENYGLYRVSPSRFVKG